MTLPREHIEGLLLLFAFDDCDSLWWRGEQNVNEAPLQFFVNCNDVFWWGTADVEEVKSAQDIADLAQAKADLPGEDWSTLWVARKRGMRPQGAMYAYFSEKEKELFDACGPEREVGLGNPSENIRMTSHLCDEECGDESHPRDGSRFKVPA